MPHELPLDELSQVIARIRGLLLTEEKVDHAVQRLAAAIRDAIPGTVGAGVSLIDAQGNRTSSGSTDQIVVRADALQYELGSGPCLTAWAAEETVFVEDLRTDPRWPEWTQAVSKLPILSLLSAPLLSGRDCIGALKIYSAQTGTYDANTGRLLELFASPAATLLAHIQANETPHRISESLTSALQSRDTINRACGILMERHGIEAGPALQLLMGLSRAQNTPLQQVSAALIDGTPASGG